MLPIEIFEPTRRFEEFTVEQSKKGLRDNLDTLEEVQKFVRITGGAIKRRIKIR